MIRRHVILGSGSSPLARGLRCGHGRPACSPRIIPARAGFTSPRSTSSGLSSDHPRSRGVYGILCAGHDASPGSSPLARGLRGARGPRGRRAGIIPARAGFTSLLFRCVLSRRDHPRSRGVYEAVTVCGRRRGGSSPLARGLLMPPLPVGVVGRIIPARAGFTRGRGTRTTRTADHPRSRGVYASGEVKSAATPGSSPLARGLPGIRGDAHNGAWIIPARAGFTSGAAVLDVVEADHPRSRGVYWRRLVRANFIGGSSPLARGLHLRILGIPTNP